MLLAKHLCLFIFVLFCFLGREGGMWGWGEGEGRGAEGTE